MRSMTTQYPEQAKVFNSKLDARWASAIVQQGTYGDGLAWPVCGGFVAVIQGEDEEGHPAEFYVSNAYMPGAR